MNNHYFLNHRWELRRFYGVKPPREKSVTAVHADLVVATVATKACKRLWDLAAVLLAKSKKFLTALGPNAVRNAAKLSTFWALSAQGLYKPFLT